jgi:hypothetical protein
MPHGVEWNNAVRILRKIWRFRDGNGESMRGEIAVATPGTRPWICLPSDER